MRVLVVLVALVVGSPIEVGRTGEAKDAVQPKVSAKVKQHLGEQTVGVLGGATKVEVFRVSAKKPEEKDKTVAGFRVTATGTDQDAKFAARVAGVVLDEDTYLWNTARGCIFTPGVALRVWKGEESVVIVICFSCDEVQITAFDKTGTAGKPAWVLIDPGRAALVKLAKAALPDDKEIQMLEEKR